MRPVWTGAQKLTLALMMVVTISGCDRVQKAARDLAGEDGDNGRPPATAAKPAPAHAVPSTVSPSPTVAVIDPPDGQVGDWHIAMTAACAAGTAEHVAHYDINGDGLPDTVCWHVIRSKTYGDFVEVDARVKAGDREQSAYRLLWVRPGEAMGLCAADHVSVKQTLWSQADLDRKGWGADHRIGLTVANDGCTPVRLFWPAGDNGDEVDFRYERN